MSIVDVTRSRWADYALAFFRIVAGVVFISVGTMKVFGYPPMPPGNSIELWSQMWIGGLMETVGGIMIVLGLFTRPVAFILSGEMAVAYSSSTRPCRFSRRPTRACRRFSTASGISTWCSPGLVRGVWTACSRENPDWLSGGNNAAAAKPSATRAEA